MSSAVNTKTFSPQQGKAKPKRALHGFLTALETAQIGSDSTSTGLRGRDVLLIDSSQEESRFFLGKDLPGVFPSRPPWWITNTALTNSRSPPRERMACMDWPFEGETCVNGPREDSTGRPGVRRGHAGVCIEKPYDLSFGIAM